jgi:hypothetical protein
MTSWDHENNQILSPLCRSCTDKRFTPLYADMENVGCCRYEPVFTLFEVCQMLRDNNETFFWNEIYHHENNTIYPYEIMVHANIDERFNTPFVQEEFERLLASKHTAYKAMELRTSFSVCSFFISGQGCGLPSHYKTHICRSFVCESVLCHGATQLRASISQWQSTIREECENFNRIVIRELKQEGIDLVNHANEVIAYLKSR